MHQLWVAETVAYQVAVVAEHVEVRVLRRSAASVDDADWSTVYTARFTPDQAREIRSALTLAIHASEDVHG